MSRHESAEAGLVTIELICDARKGEGVCGNQAKLTMQSRDAVNKFLFDLGWRLLRGHQICGPCARKPKVAFPRKATK